MAKQKNWAYTKLSDEASVVLEVGGQTFELVQFTASFAINSVPEALCSLALGRSVRDTGKKASAHKAASTLKQMSPARVTFSPSGEYAPDGTKWPAGKQVVFDGYFLGFGYRKIKGNVHLVAHLAHWLVDLGCTSTLSSISHASNPTSLTFPSIVEPLTSGGGAGGEAVFVTQLIGHELIMAELEQDLWGALQSFFCAMAQFEGFSPVCGAGQLAAAGLDVIKQNDRALRALARIEGPAGPDCAAPGVTPNAYKYARPLPLATGLREALSRIAESINYVYANEMVHQTVWDALVGYYCPQFSLDLCPMVDRATVVACCPGFRGAAWRTVRLNEYDYLDQSAVLPKPLRGVVVHGSMALDGNSGMSETSKSGPTCVAGVFASDDAGDADGAVLYLPVPPWLENVAVGGDNDATGVRDGKPANGATTPGAGRPPKEKTPGEMADEASGLLNKYARSLFVLNALRGRSGTVSGKLRFDVGPGSHLRVEGSPEQFLGGEDELAATLFAQVNRVTVEINAEDRRASTSFVLTHLRNEAENKADRTSTDGHPFYGDAVSPGAPLLPAYELTPK